eukprot:15325750-Ditylum_brightwellii.AAC.1
MVVTQSNMTASESNKRRHSNGIFCLVMDYYFTLPKVISALHDMGISVVGASCFRQGWPPKNCCDIKQQDTNFNDFY